ncbi:LacI family DNA-binding transcriptional regulator [Paenibacillus taiwanensis]|uniref:LacI family DNA-binding transcriptional regulator n=1 Tax=Paenibacillus taiwanensis TaxID=401638 RepID=UPI0004120CEE|nr:LacI family DNA-binding transcriptional regulator [Paenibacillus taiwanensis]
MTTIYDIAKLANVSPMTVSRVINNNGRVSDKTRAKVKKIMKDLHYVPNSMARSLVLQQSHIITLLITDITNPFYTTVARGAEDAANRNGYKLMFGNTDESLLKEQEYVDTFLSMRVDGVLFAPVGDDSKPHLERLQQNNMPLVLLDREVPGVTADAVIGDSKDGARKLVELLIQQGHTRIALVNGSSHVSTARERLNGYVEALKLNDLPVDPSYVTEWKYNQTGGDREVIRSWMDREDRPTAIFAANNILALETLKLLRSMDVRVPDDISLVSFDDFGQADEVSPFLTVASQPAYQFGVLGMQMLIERIQNNEQPARKLVLPCSLITRASSIPPLHLS